MDATEKLALAHLKSRGFANIVYEPDGNVPPDFLVDGEIAVEVRRLNQNEPNRPTPKGLEETEIPLLHRFRSLLASIGPPRPNRWWVTLRFKRPVPSWSKVRGPIEEFLRKQQAKGEPKAVLHLADRAIEIETFARSTPAKKAFALGITSDHDSGGWVLSELERNIDLCVRDKSKKIAKYRPRYAQWWLLLLDHVAYGLSDFDWEQFKQAVHVTHDWDKVVLVNPLNPLLYRDL
jgi:hypothetical protein